MDNIAEQPGYRARMESKAFDPLHGFDAAHAYAKGQQALDLFRRYPLPSHQTLLADLAHKATEVREALDRGEEVTITAAGQQLAVYRPHPGAVLAACLRRDYAAAGRVTPAMLDAAQSFLPDVDRKALRLAIEGALRLEHPQTEIEGTSK